VLFGRHRTSRDDFEREVLSEISYLRDVFGDDALNAAMERAARPRLGGARRRVIAEAAKRLSSAAKHPG
jgi:hypothetical protein